MDIGSSGAADGAPRRCERVDHSEALEAFQIDLGKPFSEDEPYEDHRVFDPDAKLPEKPEQVEKSEHQFIEDSAKAFLRAGATMIADAVVPGAGRVIHTVLEVQRAIKTIDVLLSDEPVPELVLTLPSPVEHLGLTLKIPLGGGDERHEGSPVALALTPESSPSIVSWAVDVGEHDDQSALRKDVVQVPKRKVLQVPEPHTSKTPAQGVRLSEFTSGRETVCLAEVDLSPLRLPESREERARALAGVAAEYAPRFRADPCLRRFDSFIVADRSRGCGVLVRLRRH